MKRSDLALVLVVVVIWGVNFVVIDYGLRALPPLLFVALRFFFTACPAVLVVRAPDVPWRVTVVVGLLACVGQFGFLFVAMSRGLPAGTASVVIQSQALFTFLFALVFLHETVTTRRLLGICAAAVGMSVIGVSRGESVPLFAIALALAGGASWGMANVVTRAARPLRPFSLLVYSAAVAPVPLVLLSVLIEGAHADVVALTHLDVPAVLSLAFIVVAATFFGFGVWYRLLSRYESSVVAPYALLVPVVGLLTAGLVNGERPSAGEVLGSLVSLVGVGLVTYTHVPPARETPLRAEVLERKGC